MNTSNLTRIPGSQTLSMIGGAAQGGSAKPKEERESLDRKHGEEPRDGTPSGTDGTRSGTVGGSSNDGRTDRDRASDAQGD